MSGVEDTPPRALNHKEIRRSDSCITGMSCHVTSRYRCTLVVMIPLNDFPWPTSI